LPASVVIVHASLLKGAPGGRLALKMLTLPPLWAAPTNIHHWSPNLRTFGSPTAIRFRTGANPAAVSKICTGSRFSIGMRRPKPYGVGDAPAVTLGGPDAAPVRER